ncbi:MAG: acylneuraminate cytidylyltransferase family protein [Planctomycetota bacterium]
MAEVVSLVPVRAGSKGLPDKNTRQFAGRPLFEHAVRQGIRTTGGCVVSTDINSILKADFDDNRQIHKRSEALATDQAPIELAIIEAIERCYLHTQTIVLLQATSPTRQDRDVHAAIELYQTGEFDLVMSVAPHDNSVLKFGTVTNDRYVPVADPAYCFANRQQLPEVFKPNGAVYVFSAAWLLENGALATNRIGALIMPLNRSLDIDTLEDFEQAERIFVSARESGDAVQEH